MKEIDGSTWTTVIRQRSGWFDIDIKEIWSYWDLILLFVRRDFLAQYKQTILGPLWFMISLVLSTLVFTVVFGKIAEISTDGLPQFLFYMSGMTAWNYFSGCVGQTSNTFGNNAHLFGKVYFPRLAVPVSVLIINLLRFSLQFGLFLAFLIYFYLNGSPIHPNLWILLTPILIIHMAALGLGMGLLISSFTVKYRDLAHAFGFVVSLWMYATPIVYPFSAVPANWQWLIALNPMTSIVEIFRYAFLGAGTIQPWLYGLSIGLTILILFIGIVLFSKVEKTFIDTV